MIRGQEVKFIKDLDVFDTNVLGLKGVFLKTNDKTDKHLIYISQIGEWCETTDDFIKLVKPGKISKGNQVFVDSVKTLSAARW